MIYKEDFIMTGSEYEWEKSVRRVRPYTAGEQLNEPGVIKLNTNENVYPPSRSVTKALFRFDELSLRLYPDPDCIELREAIAEVYNVGTENVFAGVGSDDVLSTAFLTFFSEAGSQNPIAFPSLTYAFYEVWCGLYKIPFSTIPLNEDFTLDTDRYVKGGFGGIVIANPNAPTGLALSAAQIERIVAANPQCVVIIDEAYVDFGAESCVELTKKYDNLLVVQTFSKSRSLAGLRVGYAIGNKALISYMLDVRNSINSYTLSSLAIKVGTAALQDLRYYSRCCENTAEERDRTIRRLRKLHFEVTDSKANFVFARFPAISGKKLCEDLRNDKILVRHWDNPLIKDYLRITVGSFSQMDTLVKYLEKYTSRY